MSYNTAIPRFPPGSTRDFDVTFQIISGDLSAGGSPTTTAKSLKIGAGVANANSVLAGTFASQLAWNTTVKRMVWSLLAAGGAVVGNFFKMSVSPGTIQPTVDGAYSHRAGVTRFIATMIASDAASPATGDVGMVIPFGLNVNMAALRSRNNVSVVGSTGIGIWLVNGAWIFGGKLINTPAAVLTEQAALGVSPLVPNQFEFRIWDATFTAPARVDIFVNKALVLTRYWVNPAGVVTPVLPPMDGTVATGAGASLYPGVYNTTDGPVSLGVSLDIEFMHGPADSGNL